ncbi:flagellar hook-associated protein FlgL [Methylomarinum sp. Ch1-1]|uniref:Flagellar hook-associated protein FlgL n=1 Tax=Methylomarinum roseum TaxID=3067653 RepID=A0AAU7NUL5_9GAMM|nr:flagellar hook-associated protein FlgL [Methylomarinum sp. Ch1-1]MDP4519281.1 flagellar hook-associated protein FlgL [Methylomarinum sp. Ch1-1]
MRVSTAWSQQLGVNAMLEQQAKLTKTQMQLSTGVKVLTPADDPIAAARTLDLQESIDKTAQYQDNIATARARLNIEEGSLDSAENILFRAKELAIQALNAPLNENDRLSIKYEIDQLLENMVGVANTKNANGEYIFAGDLSNIQPFVWNGDANGYVYQGGVNQRTLDIASERRVADGDLGSEVFQWVPSVSQEGDAIFDGQEIGSRSIMDTLQTLSEALANDYDIPRASIVGSRFARYGADYSGGNSTSFDLTLTDNTDGSSSTVTVNLPVAPDNGDYQSLDEVVSAINAQLGGSNMQAIADGNQLEFVSSTGGQAYTISLAEASGSFLTDFGFKDGVSGTGADLGGVLSGTKTLTSASYVSSPSSFELVAADGAKETIILDQDYADVDALIANIQGQIDGSDLAGKVVIDPDANPLEFLALSDGSAASVTINEISGTFLSDAGFSDGQTGRVFNQTANDVLSDLDAGLESLLKARTSVGARLNALDDQEIQHEKFTLDMESTLSETRDLDYAEAISRFNQQNASLQAAQQAFARVQNLSLFNYI